MESIIRAPIPSASLISLADARLALAQATDVSAVATLVDRLEVVRVAARKARLSLEAQNDWATLKLEAERKAGGMLTELRQASELHAGRPNNADNASAFLSGFEISQEQSSRWQRLSTVPEDAFRAWLEQMTEAGSEVTEVGLTGVAARMKVPEQPYVRFTSADPRQLWATELATEKIPVIRPRPELGWRVDPVSDPGKLVDPSGEVDAFSNRSGPTR
jgi:hypothetical protein